MLYAIISQDVKNSLPKRLSVRPAHIERLNNLNKQGRLILAGPHPNCNDSGFSGSLVVAEFGSLEAAQNWADNDPYKKSGAYASIIVKPFKQVLP